MAEIPMDQVDRKDDQTIELKRAAFNRLEKQFRNMVDDVMTKLGVDDEDSAGDDEKSDAESASADDEESKVKQEPEKAPRKILRAKRSAK